MWRNQLQSNVRASSRSAAAVRTAHSFSLPTRPVIYRPKCAQVASRRNYSTTESPTMSQEAREVEEVFYEHQAERLSFNVGGRQIPRFLVFPVFSVLATAVPAIMVNHRVREAGNDFTQQVDQLNQSPELGDELEVRQFGVDFDDDDDLFNNGNSRQQQQQQSVLDVPITKKFFADVMTIKDLVGQAALASVFGILWGRFRTGRAFDRFFVADPRVSSYSNIVAQEARKALVWRSAARTGIAAAVVMVGYSLCGTIARYYIVSSIGDRAAVTPRQLMPSRTAIDVFFVMNSIVSLGGAYAACIIHPYWFVPTLLGSSLWSFIGFFNTPFVPPSVVPRY